MTTEAQTIAALAVDAEKAGSIINVDGREFVLFRLDQQLKDISEPGSIIAPLADHIRQGVTLQTVDSLVDYVNRFRTDNTILFADIQANSIAGLIDYHAPADAGRVAHKANMALPFSEEWQTWKAVDGKLMEQIDFARFLEENAVDVVAPSGADLLETCRDLQARRKVDFRKAVRTSTDNENFEYSDNTTATTKNGGVEVPSKFKLSIPVYFGSEPTELFAFLRWRLEEANLKLGVKLHRAEHVRQAVFRHIVLDAAGRTERPAVFGKAS